MLELASGRFDALSGRYIHAEHDPPDELEAADRPDPRRGSERDPPAPRTLTLYQPELFEPLTDEGWNEARVRDGIARIVADRRRGLRGRVALAGRRVGRVADARAAEEPLRRRRRRDLGAGRVARPEPRGAAHRPGRRRGGGTGRVASRAGSDGRGRAAVDARGGLAQRRDGDPHRRVAVDRCRRARRRPVRARARERGERSRGHHVGHAGHARRRPPPGGHDRRGALARRLPRERGGTLGAPRRGRPLDAAALRRGVPGPCDRTRARGQRPGAAATPRRRPPRAARARDERDPRPHGLHGERGRELAGLRSAAARGARTARSGSNGARGRPAS